MRILFLIIFCGLIFFGCKKDVPVPPQDESINLQLQREAELKKEADLSAVMPAEPDSRATKEEPLPQL